MPLRLLDTDHISLALRGNPNVSDRLKSLPKSQWAVSVISIQEIFNGWIVSLNDPRYKDQQIAAVVLTNQATLVTRNPKDFALVPGLAIEDWN